MPPIPELPVHHYEAQIVETVGSHQVTIIVAETGAGKSTQVPQYLARHGYRRVIVTQPRIIAARNLCGRVREEYSWHLGRDASSLVGYRTAHEQDDSPENTILYCTDGLQLVRELTGSGTRDRQVLVLDEIHEWNENMEVLLAWAKKRCREDSDFRVVLMSATIESDTLATYFDGAPIITVPGRSHPVTRRHGSNVVDEIAAQCDGSGRNMLVFLPGKHEIELVAQAVAAKAGAMSIPVIPLHGQLEPEVQQRAFASYPQGKIVLTTNVAQTSITIDDIDSVIDSGLERRSEVRNGVQGLFIAQTSQADCDQRAGRAGRTKPGIYVLAQLDVMPCDTYETRPPYGIPEILRTHIDRLVLRLAAIGMDIDELDFYHAPSSRTIARAKQTLLSLGALTSAGEVTGIGRKMERFPVESSYARMLVEAEPLADHLQALLATMIAIQEVGGIVKSSTRYTGWRKLTRHTRSDLLAQYDVYRALDTVDPEKYEELGIISKNVTKAQEVDERLHRDLGLAKALPRPIEDADIDPVLRCVVAGLLDQVWLVDTNGEALHLVTKNVRELSSGSVVPRTGLVVGVPFDLQIPSLLGSFETLHLVTHATAVKPEWLTELAPTTYRVRPSKTYYDSRYGMLATKMSILCAGATVEVAGPPLYERSARTQKLFSDLYGSWLHERLEAERRELQDRTHRKLPAVPLKTVQQHVRSIAVDAVMLEDLSKGQQIQLAKLAKLETYVGRDRMAQLQRESDNRRQGHHRSWRPPHQRHPRH